MSLLPADALAHGIALGVSYGLLACGLVLVFRTNRVINLAHGETGAVGAAILAKLVIDEHWPFLAALALVCVLGAALGAALELTVVRRLVDRGPVALLVGTLGIAQLLLVVQFLLPELNTGGKPYPTPFTEVLTFGSAHLGSPELLVLAVAPAVVVGLALLLTRTPLGLMLRATADNREAAELAGVRTRVIGTFAWATAGLLATLTVVLTDGLNRVTAGVPLPSLGPALLLRALVAALIGRLVSLSLALAGGVGVGVLEAVLYTRYPGHLGDVDLALLALLLVLLPLRRRASGGGADLSLVPPSAVVRLPVIGPWPKRLDRTLVTTSLVVAAALPLLLQGAGALFQLGRLALLLVVALSVVVLTGWAGEVSLGQGAVFGLGAFVTAAFTARGVPFAAAFVEAAVAGALLAALLGSLALRVRGLFLAVSTLAFAVAATSSVFQLDFFSGDTKTAFTARPDVLTGNRSYTAACLAFAVLACTAIAALRRSGVGRAVIATRSNPARAAAMSISTRASGLAAFVLAGALCGAAGALYAGLAGRISFTDFGVQLSYSVLAIALVGGLTSVTAAVLGTAWVLGLPLLLGRSTVVELAVSGVGVLLLLLYVPTGLAGLLALGRDAAARRLGGEELAPAPAVLTERTPRPPAPPLLTVNGVTVRFGGRLALDQVDLTIAPGEVLGLIGANGAGKSTLLDVVAGRRTPEFGQVLLGEADLSGLRDHERARLGFGRVFQDARLFQDLTTREVVMLACESRDRAELVPSLLALPMARRSERAKRAAADDVLDRLGLGVYADRPVTGLSTGTRRVVELACLLAQQARILLLDEPTAGLAQRESEAFIPLLVDLRAELGASVLLVEHDIPLVLALSDRVQCLSRGTTLAVGSPSEVADDPLVVADYLGTDPAAVARSGAFAGR
jgi:ABC-type branched-subunit amino acid transport system ATPase component/ABC-type branched-subunit amino acid transport system permease subunit